MNLPETVKGALFARYSRYAGTLRRLFLDEFADSLPDVPVVELSEGDRAAQLYETIFLGYGDDSVAQLGGAHIACEWTSNLLTKILQRPRLAAYLEQSTRYIAYDAQLDGFGYRYHRDARFGPAYEAAMDELFATYSALLEGVSTRVDEKFPAAEGESPSAHRRAVRAKALDLVRGVLPAASLSHVGIYATGQTYEQLVLHLLAHPLAEARSYGEMLLAELQAVMPSFVARVPRPDRGGRWIEYLRERGDAAATAASPRARARRGDRRSCCSVGASAPRARQRGGAARIAPLRGVRSRRGAGARSRRAPVAPRSAQRSSVRPRRRARESPAPARPRIRDAPLPVRDRLRLRRLPRPAAASPAHVPVAAAVAGPRRRRPARGRGRRSLGPDYERALRDLACRVRASARSRPRRRGALRALPRLSHVRATCSSSTPARRCT